jgi:hypothetical protein
VATNTLRHDTGSRRTGTPIGTVATLIAIYTAFYLAVVGIVHFMSSPDATAAITPATTTAASVAYHAREATDELPADQLAEPGTAATDNSRECALDAGVDSECTFN